ncbi:MAG TPA: hypothetical protein VLT51_17960 [Anaerolineales bacterium]|nr:hypothetical protein [Anaerolineales bacterium]
MSWKDELRPATRLGGIVEASLSNESQDQIIDQSHDLACVAPMRSADLQQLFRGDPLACQAGDPIDKR